MKETEIMRRIMVECADVAVLMRYNVGLFFSADGRPIKQGVSGTSDLIGFRISDGAFVAIEVKTENGRLREDQKRFLTAMGNYGIISGVARSTEDARNIIEGGLRYGKL